MRSLALCFALTACGGMQWHDAALEAGFIGATVLDMKQTEVITADCHEGNPIIGECGQHISPTAYFPLALAAHLVVTMLIPNGPCRTAWQGFTFGLESTVVFNNWSDGVRIDWNGDR